MTMRNLHDALLRTLVPMTFEQMVAIASRQGVAAAIRAATIVRVLPNQYASAVHAGSWLVRAHAALAWAGPQAMLGGASALHLWDVLPPPATVSLVAPWEERPRGPAWLRVRRFTTLPERHELNGLPVVAPELAVILAHAEAPAGSRAEAVFAPVRAGLVTAEDVARVLATVARVRGRRELTDRLAAASDGAQSYVEEVARSTVLDTPECDGIVRQHVVSVDRTTYCLDAFDPATLTAIELDGHATHGSREARRRDLVRDARLASIGILTLRFDYAEVVGNASWCRRIVADVLRTRVPGVPVGTDLTRGES